MEKTFDTAYSGSLSGESVETLVTGTGGRKCGYVSHQTLIEKRWSLDKHLGTPHAKRIKIACRDQCDIPKIGLEWKGLFSSNQPRGTIHWAPFTQRSKHGSAVALDDD